MKWSELKYQILAPIFLLQKPPFNCLLTHFFPFVYTNPKRTFSSSFTFDFHNSSNPVQVGRKTHWKNANREEDHCPPHPVLKVTATLNFVHLHFNLLPGEDRTVRTPVALQSTPPRTNSQTDRSPNFPNTPEWVAYVEVACTLARLCSSGTGN